MAEYEFLTVTIEDGVAAVVINRPASRNALSKATNHELQRLAMALGEDHQVRVVTITGAGDKAFCAGADLKERKGVSAEETGPYVDAIAGAINAWGAIPQPTVAIVNGHAFGGGLELALACDFRIAAEEAQLGLTEVRLGIMPGAGGTQRLPRLIGLANAKRLILSGMRIDADRALAIGLVDSTAPRAKLGRVAKNFVAELLKAAPQSLIQAKRAIIEGMQVPLAEGLAIERQCYDVTLFTEDRNEGLRAFADKRAPEFSGK